MGHYRLHRDPRSSHQQIARLARRLKASPILDVGAAFGFLGQLLQGTGLPIDAIEPNPEWAEQARRFYRHIYETNVEEAPLPAKTYRLIVCADVLEHVVDPVAALKRLREAATPDATFVISLPNVAHLAVRLILLSGHFPAMERGILDRTHLHFYTRQTATKMLRDAGLRVVQASPTGVPLDELWASGEGNLAFSSLMRLQHAALRAAPGPFAYQWVYIARAA